MVRVRGLHQFPSQVRMMCMQVPGVVQSTLLTLLSDVFELLKGRDVNNVK